MVFFQVILNPVGNKIVDGFFPPGREELSFEDFAQTFAIFRPQKSSKRPLPDEAVNSREAKVASQTCMHSIFFQTDASFVSFQIKFLYCLIDSDMDGWFCKEDIYNILILMMGPEVP